MRKLVNLVLLFCGILPALGATGVRGTVVDAQTGAPVSDANILLADQGIFVTSAADGSFSIGNASAGPDRLQIVAFGYNDLTVPVDIKEGLVSDLGSLKMTVSAYDSALIGDDYSFDESQVLDDEGGSQAIGTIRGAVDDVFYQAANYNFSIMRFRQRGYQSDWTAGYINGMNFNDAMRGRFNYSMLGGMTSSAFRNKTVEVGLAPANFGFSNIGGGVNFTTYASEYAPGFRGNLSYTNSNYMFRAMLQYNTGLLPSGWAFSASIIGRYADEGVIKGTFYNSFGYSLSLQKVFNDKHSLNLTTWGAPTQRATNSATYEEAYDLAGSNLYNPNWGYQNGKKRSAKIVESFDPSAILNWIFKPKMGTVLNTSLAFRHSAYSSSALNWYQAADPRPDYYRYLPSYYEPTAEPGTELYDSQLEQFTYYTDLWRHDKQFRQINWDQMYQTNLLNRDQFDRNPELKGQSTYILEDRHSDFTAWMFNSYINTRLNDWMTLQAGVSFNYTDGHYYKTIRDLLGGEFWRDIDNFSERDFPDNPTMLENNMNNPGRRVKKGDKFGYDYNIRSYIAKGWIQNEINTRHWDVNYGLEIVYTNFMRHGQMRNGRAPENSFGAGKRHTFDDAAVKAGATYKINGRNYFVAHAAYGSRAPLPDYAYVSPRIKDTSVTGLASERYLSGDISYMWNYSNFRGAITGFWTEMWDGIKRTSFYDDKYSTFMNYVMSGIRTSYKGVEIGLAYKIVPSVTLSAAATYSRYQYKNRPLGVRSYENGAHADVVSRVYLKNYYVGGTPQQAYNIGIDWAAPGRWFFNLNASWLGDSYVDLAAIRHEPMTDLWRVCETKQELEDKVHEITDQEKLKNCFVMNFSVGKVIYTKFGSLNFNLSINNLLNNRNIQTGGYQQGRFDYDNFNIGKYPNKYYYAQGIRVFFNVGVRF